MSPQRRLVYDFVELPHVVRMQIVSRLGLSQESDGQLPEKDREVLYFRRAQENNLLNELRREIDMEKLRLTL